jgi:hypothetical protein
MRGLFDTATSFHFPIKTADKKSCSWQLERMDVYLTIGHGSAVVAGVQISGWDSHAPLCDLETCGC